MHLSPILILFMQVGLILALSRVVGLLFTRLRQPQVMGEMVAGILLGPSLFGLVAPQSFGFVFPKASLEALNLLSQVGVIFFLFLIGLELDPKLLRSRARAAVIISNASVVAPFVLGIGLTFYLYPKLFDDPGRTHFTATALFMGAAMSITAFPVLARILTERNLLRTRVGVLAVACAAVNDATAWCMLAFVVAVARANGVGQAVATMALSSAYVALMFFVVRPFLRQLERVYDRQGRLSQNVISVIFLLIISSAYATEMIGIHALFGAFLMGAIMPKGTQFVRHLSEKLEDYTVVFLLPIFFASAGLKTQIGLLNSGELWFYTGLIIFVACLGKFGGSMLAARLCGINAREASAIGILMNTRGLMELVILLMGRELGVINDAVFAMMVLMAIVTTAMTTPILHWVYPHGLLAEDEGRKAGVGGEGSGGGVAGGVAGGSDGGARLRPADAFSILIPVALPKSGGPLVQLADTLIGRKNEFGRLYALHLRRPADHAVYRSGLDEASQGHDESLSPLLAQARGRGIPVEPLSFVSRDVPADIAAVAKARNVNLVLIGFHKPVIGRTILGGTVHRVLTHCESDVAIFVDRGFRQARRILVPYLGSEHDRLAMELAGRMARNTEAQVTVLHVVPPMRGEAGRTLDAKGAVDRVFSEPGQKNPVAFRVIEDSSPVGVVLHQAQQADLVVIGVAEEWGLESHLFGWRAERIARDCPSPLLIVRKFGSGAGTRGMTAHAEAAKHRADETGAGPEGAAGVTVAEMVPRAI